MAAAHGWVGSPRTRIGVDLMVTGFDYLSQDRLLREHWLKRFIAVFVDFIIVYTPILLISEAMGSSWQFPGYFGGVALFLYAFLFESSVGGTIGKMIMKMKAVPMHGIMSPTQALIRNLTKVFPVFLLLDWVIGMAVDTKDPRQKWTDQIAHTSVIIHGHPSGA